MKRTLIACAATAVACGCLAFGLGALAPASPLVLPAQAKARVTTVKMSSSSLSFGKVASKYYTGKAIKPKVTVKFKTKKLTAGAQYKVAYSNNTAIGTAKITLKAKAKTFAYKGKKYQLTGSKTVKFKIVDPVEASLSAKKVSFTGSAIEPEVTVKYKGKELASGSYSVSYSNNTKVGTGEVHVQGLGSYADLIDETLTFEILQADTSYSLNKFSGASVSDVATANAQESLARELDTTTRIVDVSYFQEDIDWTQVAKQVDVAFMRAYVTYRAHKNYGDDGKMIQDEKYDDYATGCEENGLPYAAYGYLIFTNATDTLADAKKDAEVQAEKLWNAAFSNGHAPLYLILDLESTNMSAANPTDVVPCTKAAIDKLQELALENGYANGIKIGLYIANHLYDTFGFTTTAGEKLLDEQADFLWIPTYGKDTGEIPTAYYPKYACDLWQYTSAGTVSGIDGDADLSVINTAGPNSRDITWYKER